MNTCPRIHYQVTGQGLVLTACYGVDGRICLPDEIEGRPFTAIAPYAFSENETSGEDLVWIDPDLSMLRDIRRLKTTDIAEIRLPSGIREIGRYAFYRCRNLEKLTLCDGILEIGGGAFNGCRLKEVEIHCRNGKKSALKSIVDEIRFPIHARIFYSLTDKVCLLPADLLFPEHYEEAVENTPARILYTSHHGAGGYYRQCFYDREVDYKKYDGLLPWAIAHEEEETVIRLAMGRLKYPYDLSEKARDDYEDYLAGHQEEAARFFVTEEDLESIEYLSDRKLWSREGLTAGIEAASRQHRTEIAARLMEVMHREFSGRKKSFDL